MVIHTEEEFEWGRLDRTATAVTHMDHIRRVQDLFDEQGIVPTYVVDYPIVDQDAGCRPLLDFAADGRAVIGAHLHPWVSPPHVEALNFFNSYPGNLPCDLEREKLTQLTERIAARFGVRPTVYLAGRYGFGPNTAALLEDLGYEVDVSAIVPLDFSGDGGPDYSGYTNHPYWFGRRRRLLGLPCTGDFVGWLPGGKRRLHWLASRPLGERLRLRGVLARLRAVERMSLTPEGHTNAELRRLTRSLLRRGFRTFVFSFHSPSIQPGCTPYVRDAHELRTFLDNCRDYFTFFLKELNGVARTPLQIRADLEQPCAVAAPLAVQS